MGECDTNFLQINATLNTSLGLIATPHRYPTLTAADQQKVSSDSWFAQVGQEYGWLCEVIVLLVFFGLTLLVLWSLCFGFPQMKPPDIPMQGSHYLTIYLGTVISFFYFSTDQYVPSMPQMEVELKGSQTLLSVSVQLNLLLKTLCGLIFAPLSDAYGRKPILVGCQALMILGSFSCALAPNMNWFLMARIVQAMGEAAGPLIYAIIRDCYADGQERLTALSVVCALTLIGPTIAPVIGGFVASSSHWRVSFLCLSLIWVGLTAGGAFGCTETNRHPVRPHYGEKVWRVLADPQLVAILVTEMFVLGTYYSFNASWKEHHPSWLCSKFDSDPIIIWLFWFCLSVTMQYASGLSLLSPHSIFQE